MAAFKELTEITDFDQVPVHEHYQQYTETDGFGFRPDWPGIVDELIKRPLLMTLGFILTGVFAVEYHLGKVREKITTADKQF